MLTSVPVPSVVAQAEGMRAPSGRDAMTLVAIRFVFFSTDYRRVCNLIKMTD
ncbi:hypothetical protein ACW73L_14140 [Methylolobus aquaticus]